MKMNVFIVDVLRAIKVSFILIFFFVTQQKLLFDASNINLPKLPFTYILSTILTRRGRVVKKSQEKYGMNYART
jgi:hypothetical protein